jgi:DNA-binding MarR family transcriptional regulator
MSNLTNEQRRALRILARYLDGCAEAVLLAEGFSVGQLALLALEGLAETRRGQGGQRVWIRITEAGRQAIAE